MLLAISIVHWNPDTDLTELELFKARYVQKDILLSIPALPLKELLLETPEWLVPIMAYAHENRCTLICFSTQALTILKFKTYQELDY